MEHARTCSWSSFVGFSLKTSRPPMAFSAGSRFEKTKKRLFLKDEQMSSGSACASVAVPPSASKTDLHAEVAQKPGVLLSNSF